MRGLKGKTAIVTGSGIGRAIALRLASEGVTVGVFDINPAGAAETVKAIAAADGKSVAVSCDITDYAGVTKAVAEFEAAIGEGTEILVNNAGWDTPMPFLKTDEAFWKKVVAINYMGPLHMTHAVGQGMNARKSGRIINIASDAGRVGSSGEVVYSGCKGATIAFGKALAREVARSQITVNTVCPARPTRRRWMPLSAAARPARRSATRWCAACRSGASACPTTTPVSSRFSPATTRLSSPARRSASRAVFRWAITQYLTGNILAPIVHSLTRSER